MVIATSSAGQVVGLYGRATNSPNGTGVVGYGGATGGYFTSTRPDGRAAFFDGNVIINAGNVGVGTVTPSYPFHINLSAAGSSPLAGLLQPNLVSGGLNQIYLGRTPSDNGCATLTYTHVFNPALSLLSLGLYGSSYTLNLVGNGNVGIGTTSPTHKLQVAGSTQIDGTLRVRNDNESREGIDLRDSANQVVFAVTLGLPGESHQLAMHGDAYKSSGGTSWGTFSDRRLKQDVRPYEAGLNEILQLRPVRFRYRDDSTRGLSSAHVEAGFIAQEVREVIPDAVTEGKDGYLTLKADPIHWAAINAIQQLNAKLQEQRAENAGLKQRLEKLEQLMKHQEVGAK